jgi:hypothetical protein
MNAGYSSRMPYDTGVYKDKLEESTGPLMYRVNDQYNTNCDACLSTLGPRSGYQGYGVSTAFGLKTPISQNNVDIDSILSNRNVKASQSRRDQVNSIGISDFKFQHPRICGDFLNATQTRLTDPASTYRGMAINRFENLPQNPQDNIFWDFSRNTTLEAKDNFRFEHPSFFDNEAALPKPIKGKQTQCKYGCQAYCQHDNVSKPSKKTSKKTSKKPSKR